MVWKQSINEVINELFDGVIIVTNYSINCFNQVRFFTKKPSRMDHLFNSLWYTIFITISL